MTAYSEENLIIDFVRRTKCNLLFIEDSVKENPDKRIYEVTQLINSLIGLVVLPFEKLKYKETPKGRYYLTLPNLTIEEMVADGWEAPKVTEGFPKVEDLHQLVNYLRNAVAHFNIEFLVNPRTKHISGVIVENYHQNTGEMRWQAEMSIKALRDNVLRFIDLLEQAYAPDAKPYD